MPSREWKEKKRRILEKLEAAKLQGLADEKSLSLVDAINSNPCWCTTSSCAGRIHLYEVSTSGDKKGLKTLGKWHGPVGLNELKEAVSKRGKREVWLKVEGPIVHVEADKGTEDLLKKAYAAGFKYSSLKSSRVVEIATTERMELPLGRSGRLMVDEAYLGFLVSSANEKLRRAQSKIGRLEKLASHKS